MKYRRVSSEVKKNFRLLRSHSPRGPAGRCGCSPSSRSCSGTGSFSAPAAAAHFGVADAPPLEPRPHLFPKQLVAVVGLKGDGTTRALALLSWGLVPCWANE